jgi:hypothetical protein
MGETEHRGFFKTHKILPLLPLLVLAAAMFWYASRHKTEKYSGREPREPDLAGFAPAARFPARPARDETRGFSAADIQGSPEFRSQVIGALRLIWMADRETFYFIRKYIFIIRSENKTDFYLDAGRPVAAISNAHAFRSMPWCAGIIAHQAFHSYTRFRTVKKNTFLPPPPGTERHLSVEANPMSVKYTSLGSLLAEEHKASGFQVKVMSATGASRALIGGVEKRTSRDFKTGHDGNYSIKP